MKHGEDEHTGDKVLMELLEGNARYVGQRRLNPNQSDEKRNSLISGQSPQAIILGCSDSRAPAELVFDQGLGDLFVIRIAGNVVAPSQIQSVEFAVKAFGTPLVVVMGHSGCGAVMATLDELACQDSPPSPALRSIIGRVRPAVESVPGAGSTPYSDDVLQNAIRANVRASVDQLRDGSDALAEMLAAGTVAIVAG